MADDLGTAYTGHDDINDKLVLDLAWERQQKKVRMFVKPIQLLLGASSAICDLEGQPFFLIFFFLIFLSVVPGTF